VLDSPLVTYRPPDQSTETDGGPPEGVVRAFYRDIQANFDGQIIIMENTDPLEPLGAEARDIRFTKHTDVGRCRFPACRRWRGEQRDLALAVLGITWCHPGGFILGQDLAD